MRRILAGADSRALGSLSSVRGLVAMTLKRLLDVGSEEAWELRVCDGELYVIKHDENGGAFNIVSVSQRRRAWWM